MRNRQAGRPWEKGNHNTPDYHLYPHGAGTVHTVINSTAGTAADGDAHGSATECDTLTHGSAAECDTITNTHSQHARASTDSNAHSYGADKYTHTVGTSHAAAGANSHSAAATHGHTDAGSHADQCHDPELRLRPESYHRCAG